MSTGIARHRNISRNIFVPKFRFSGFVKQWDEIKFGDIFNFKPTNSFSRDKLNYKIGDVRNIHYGDIHTKFHSSFYLNKEKVPFINKEIDLSRLDAENYCRNGDLIIADASEDYVDIGKSIEIMDLNGEKVLSGLHTLIARPENNYFAKGILGYLMRSNTIRMQIMILSQGIKVLGISSKHLNEIYFKIPEIKEQQKIARFLIKVDELIRNLKEQKENLEKYKKGMMQKIFGQKIRFRDEGGNKFEEWKEKKLGDVSKFWNGKAHEQDVSENGKYVIVNSKFISSDGVVKKFTNKQISPLYKDDIAMVMSDIPKGKAISKCFLIDEEYKYTLNQRIGGIKSSKIVSGFLIRVINRNKYFLKFDNGVSQTNLRKEEILRCPVRFPELKEQKKIADFLGKIDEVIDLKQKEIIRTEEWKKGLMQGLFV